MLAAIKDYILANPVQGLLTPPWRAPLRSWAPVPLFAVIAIWLGLSSELLHWRPVSPTWGIFLAIALFVSPAFLEELLFRGLLIPRAIAERGLLWAALAIGWSTLPYVLSHPLGALTTSGAAKDYFLQPVFLLIVALLGISCGYSYVISRSLWLPVLIHWFTVLCWVFLLGGYDVVLALEGDVWGSFDS